MWIALLRNMGRPSPHGGINASLLGLWKTLPIILQPARVNTHSTIQVPVCLWLCKLWADFDLGASSGGLNIGCLNAALFIK